MSRGINAEEVGDNTAPLVQSPKTRASTTREPTRGQNYRAVATLNRYAAPKIVGGTLFPQRGCATAAAGTLGPINKPRGMPCAFSRNAFTTSGTISKFLAKLATAD